MAEWNRLNPLTLEKQYKEHLSDFRTWEKINNADALVYPENCGPNLSIDEVALSKGELYTVLTNKAGHGKQHALVALIKGTKNKPVTEALTHIPFAQRLVVQEVTLDLAISMDWIVSTNFPQAHQTADRFHVQQIISEAVQEIRIEERRKVLDREYTEQKTDASNGINGEKVRKRREQRKEKVYANDDTEKQLLARARYLLFKPPTKWTDSQKERADILFAEYPTLKQAYEYSLHFRSIFERKIPPKTAEEELRLWCSKVQTSSLLPLISATHTIEQNIGKILGYFNHRSTNAGAESFNSKLKGFRALVRGVRDTKFFLYRIEKLYA